MKYLAFVLASAALMGAQTPAISIQPSVSASGRPTAARSSARMSAPALGYLAGPGALDLQTIVGSAKGARLGEAVSLPKGVKRYFLPPREHYLLLESSGNEELAVWSPMKNTAETTPLGGAMAHPDAVTFSGRGDAALIYSRVSANVELIVGLPAEPVVTTLPAIGRTLDVISFAVSDDGLVSVAQLADNTAMVSVNGKSWQRLAAAFGARALLFASRSHNLVVSDTTSQSLTLLMNLDTSAPVGRLLASGIAADELAATKEGDFILAASSSQNKLWTVDLKTFSTAPASSVMINSLIPLRDGHTFLLSPSSLSLLTVPAEKDSALEFVPVTR